MPRPKKDTPEGREASRKWRETMEQRYGNITERQRIIGAMGGRNGKGPGYKGGFASNSEFAKKAGAKGGSKSRRGKSYKEQWEKIENEALKLYESGISVADISRKFEMPYGVIMKRIKKGI